MCVTVGAVCVTELFMLGFAVSLMDALAMVGYMCSTGEGSDGFDNRFDVEIELNESYVNLLRYDRMLWVLLGAKYSMSVVACCKYTVIPITTWFPEMALTYCLPLQACRLQSSGGEEGARREWSAAVGRYTGLEDTTILRGRRACCQITQRRHEQ